MLQMIARMCAPPSCVRCHREGKYLCRVCLQYIASVPAQACFGCGGASVIGVTCMRCRVLVAPLALSVGATFDGEVRTLIARLKYRHQREIGGLLAARLAPLLSGTDFDFVTAVPVAPSRLRSRGYNQAEQIARPLAVKLGLPYRHVLFRAKNVRQVGKSSSQRQLQSRNAFIAPPLPLLTRILLVDDVMTTGATLNECAKALVKSSNAKVWVAVAARKDRG